MTPLHDNLMDVRAWNSCSSGPSLSSPSPAHSHPHPHPSPGRALNSGWPQKQNKFRTDCQKGSSATPQFTYVALHNGALKTTEANFITSAPIQIRIRSRLSHRKGSVGGSVASFESWPKINWLLWAGRQLPLCACHLLCVDMSIPHSENITLCSTSWCSWCSGTSASR